MKRAAPHLSEESILVSTVQGIEVETCMRMDPVFEEVLDPVHPPRLVLRSGPSFAREIVGGMSPVGRGGAYDLRRLRGESE